MPVDSPLPVVVVGGGLTGLSAAWEVARQGQSVVVVEEQRWGGKVHSQWVDGFLIESGADSFVTYRPGAMQAITELGLADQVVPVVPPRLVHLRVNGRLEPIPEGMGMVLPTKLGPFVTTRILTWPQKLRAGVDVFLPRQLGPQDASIGSLLRRRLGAGVVTRFADPLVGGIYGSTVDDLSIDAVLPMLRTYERDHRSLIRASLAQGGAKPAGAGSPFRTLHDGLGSLVQALVDQLHKYEARMLLGVRVQTLQPGATHPTVVLSDGTVIAAQAVILAGGARSSASLLQDVAPAASAELKKIPHTSTASVHLGFDRDAFASPPVGHGYLEAGPAPITGVTIVSGKWPDRAPADTVLVRAFVPDRVGPAAKLDDEQLLAAVCDHVSTVMGARKPPRLTHLVRWQQVMPTYTVGHRDRVQRAEEALVLVPGVRLAGSAVHGVGIPECIADGRAVARSVLGAEPATVS